MIETWEYYTVLQHYSQLYKNLFVNLKNENRYDITKKETRRICSDVLTPLANIATSGCEHGVLLSCISWTGQKKVRWDNFV